MYVAQQEGFFEEHGVAVEFIPVASAAERDQVMAAGEGDGMINDIISTLFYNQNQTQIQVVRLARTATSEFPQYRILAAKDSGITQPDQMKGVEIGVSEGTVIQYLTDRLLELEGLSPEEIVTIPVPSIADRMALLDSGELEAATLPDPLSSLAIQNGAVVVVDDTKYPELGYSLLSFRKEVIDQYPDAIRGFLLALEQAVQEVNQNPEKWADLLVEKNLVPAPLVGNYEIPQFPTTKVPTETQFADGLDWAKREGLISTDVSYSESVTADYLP